MEDTEGKIQQNIYVWFHNTYPHLRGLLCYNLNNSKNKIDGALNKSKGLQAGRADMVLYYNSKAYMIELKTAKGTQSEDQIKWQKQIESNGFEYHIIRSLDEFKAFINNLDL